MLCMHIGRKIMISKNWGEPPSRDQWRSDFRSSSRPGEKVQLHAYSVCVCQMSDRHSTYFPVRSALSVSCIVVLFFSCYRQRFIHPVEETLYDPVLQHSSSVDFDVYVGVHAYVHVYHGEATLSQTSAPAGCPHGLFSHSYWIDNLSTLLSW